MTRQPSIMFSDLVLYDKNIRHLILISRGGSTTGYQIINFSNGGSREWGTTALCTGLIKFKRCNKLTFEIDQSLISSNI